MPVERQHRFIIDALVSRRRGVDFAAGGPTTVFPSRQLHRLGVILLFLGVGHAVDLGAQPRPRVGVALGGGSARGIAHVGVLRWLEEHHIPVDVVAGTSMGGLIGGSYATGMTPDEIEVMLGGIDWDAMFGSSDFEFPNVRRKRDCAPIRRTSSSA